MKTKLILSFICLGFFSSISAQPFAERNLSVSKSQPGYRTTFETNPFWHNWFVSANFGANAFFAENSSKADFKNTITFMPVLSVGKWFNPWWGLRVQGGGGSLHGFTGNAMLHNHYMYAHADFMFGLFNFFGKYTPERKFDLVPFAGIGGMTRKKDQSFTINAGIQARYAISERFDINIEFEGMILDDDMVVRGGFPNDGIGGLTAGITYRFKNRKFTPVKYSQDEVDGLYADNNALRQELDAQKNKKPEVQVVEKEVVKEVCPGAKAFSDLCFVVPFSLGSSKIKPANESILWNVNKFMKAYPDLKIVVTGYADKSGTKAGNLKLSQKRAEAVAGILEKDYGIPAERLIIKYEGAERPFYQTDNQWNRCAIIQVAQ